MGRRISWSTPIKDVVVFETVNKEYHSELFYDAEDYDDFETDLIEEACNNEEVTASINRWLADSDSELGVEDNCGGSALSMPSRRQSIEVDFGSRSGGSGPKIPHRRESMEIGIENQYAPMKPCRRASVEKNILAPSVPIRRTSVEVPINILSPDKPTRRGSIEVPISIFAPKLPSRRQSVEQSGTTSFPNFVSASSSLPCVDESSLDGEHDEEATVAQELEEVQAMLNNRLDVGTDNTKKKNNNPPSKPITRQSIETNIPPRRPTRRESTDTCIIDDKKSMAYNISMKRQGLNSNERDTLPHSMSRAA